MVFVNKIFVDLYTGGEQAVVDSLFWVLFLFLVLV